MTMEVETINFFLRNNKKILILTIVLTVITAFITMAIPLLLNRVFNTKTVINYQLILLVVFFMCVTYIVQIILVIIRENFAEKFNSNYARSLYNRLFRMKYDRILKLESTYLVERIGQAVDAYYMFISNSLVNIISNTIIVVTSLILFLNVNVFLAVMLFCLLPLNYLGYKMINKKLLQKSIVMQEQTASGYKEIISIFKNIDTVKQEYSFERIDNLIQNSLTKIYSSRSSVNKFGQSSSLIIKLINNFVQNAMFFMLGFMIFENKTNIGDLIIVSIVFPLYFSAIQSLTNVNLELRDIDAAKNFITNDLINNQEKESGMEVDKINKIEFNNVSFSIQENHYSYRCHEEIVPGDIVYIEGSSGVGKSSLMKLLLKFRDSSGIKINDIEIDQINSTSLRKLIFYFSQDFTLLPMSIRENVLFGREDHNIDWNGILSSSLLSNIFSNKSLETVVYEHGTNLSGGEKQRIMLSKILIEEYDVIILDEVTSNIDKESSDRIFKTLLESFKDKIIFIISHDKNNKLYCNKNIHLD